MSCQPIAGYEREIFSAGCTMNIGLKKLLREVASTFCGAQIMKVKICPDCGERWWCVKCGYCHWCHPDFEPPAGVAVKPRGGSPTLPSQAVTSYRFHPRTAPH